MSALSSLLCPPAPPCFAPRMPVQCWPRSWSRGSSARLPADEITITHCAPAHASLLLAAGWTCGHGWQGGPPSWKISPPVEPNRHVVQGPGPSCLGHVSWEASRDQLSSLGVSALVEEPRLNPGSQEGAVKSLLPKVLRETHAAVRRGRSHGWVGPSPSQKRGESASVPRGKGTATAVDAPQDQGLRLGNK